VRVLASPLAHLLGSINLKPRVSLFFFCTCAYYLIKDRPNDVRIKYNPFTSDTQLIFYEVFLLFWGAFTRAAPCPRRLRLI